jgi:hypothetical protein
LSFSRFSSRPPVSRGRNFFLSAFIRVHRRPTLHLRASAHIRISRQTPETPGFSVALVENRTNEPGNHLRTKHHTKQPFPQATGHKPQARFVLSALIGGQPIPHVRTSAPIRVRIAIFFTNEPGKSLKTKKAHRHRFRSRTPAPAFLSFWLPASGFWLLFFKTNLASHGKQTKLQ